MEEKWKNDILSGKSIRQIAREENCASNTIRNRLIRSGINPKDLIQQRENLEIEKISSLASKGFTRGEIADIVGISYYRVLKKIREHKIPCQIYSVISVILSPSDQ